MPRRKKSTEAPTGASTPSTERQAGCSRRKRCRRRLQSGFDFDAALAQARRASQARIRAAEEELCRPNPVADYFRELALIRRAERAAIRTLRAGSV